MPILRLEKKEKKLNTENADIVGLTRNKEYDTITEQFSVVKQSIDELIKQRSVQSRHTMNTGG